MQTDDHFLFFPPFITYPLERRYQRRSERRDAHSDLAPIS